MEDCSMEKCPFNGATFNQCKVEKDCPYYTRSDIISGERRSVMDKYVGHDDHMLDGITVGFNKALDKLNEEYANRADNNADYLKGFKDAIEIVEYHKKHWHNL